MQRRHLRRIVIAGVSVLMIGSMGFITAGISHAAPDDTTFTQTEARLGGATRPTPVPGRTPMTSPRTPTG